MKKRPMLLALAVVAFAGCSKNNPSKERPQTDKKEKSKQAVPSPAPGASRPEVAKCKLDGSYRIRFASNGADGWWFRLKIEGEKASLQESIEVLGLKEGELGLKRDNDNCGIILSVKNNVVGEMTMNLKVDSTTHYVSGTLNRTKATSEKDKQTTAEGVHDVNPVVSHAECFVPGVYKLAFDKTSKWKSEYKGDDCRRAQYFASPVVFRLEPYRDGIAITGHESYEPYEEGWPGATLVLDGDCKATIEMSTENLKLKANLTLAADGISGTTTLVDYQMVEDGTAGENIWNCIGTDVELSGIRQ